jgi:hypothetical protein
VAEAVGRAPTSPWMTEEMQRLTETLPRLWQGNEMGEHPQRRVLAGGG